ncbi:MAG: hypothetical protein K8W52_10230 [Deltaproteobacteria bacterium]|nr:hypothetical protein [Deltaproteobacteria bacterium]
MESLTDETEAALKRGADEAAGLSGSGAFDRFGAGGIGADAPAPGGTPIGDGVSSRDTSRVRSSALGVDASVSRAYACLDFEVGVATRPRLSHGMRRRSLAAIFVVAAVVLSVRVGVAGGAKVGVLPPGSGWYCFEIPGGGMGACSRTKNSCEIARHDHWKGAETEDSRCLPQPKTAVLTYWLVMLDRWGWTATRAVSECKKFRAYLVQKGDDNTKLSSCTVVGMTSGSKLDRKVIPRGSGWLCLTWGTLGGTCLRSQEECAAKHDSLAADSDYSDVADCEASTSAFASTANGSAYIFPTREMCEDSLNYIAGASLCAEIP